MSDALDEVKKLIHKYKRLEAEYDLLTTRFNAQASVLNQVKDERDDYESRYRDAIGNVEYWEDTAIEWQETAQVYEVQLREAEEKLKKYERSPDEYAEVIRKAKAEIAHLEITVLEKEMELEAYEDLFP